MRTLKVRNMTSTSGNDVPNQFIIDTNQATFFQSYSTMIAKRNSKGLFLDRNMWDYSTTTSKYRNAFTGLTTKETKEGIADKSIKLVDLN